MWALASLKCLNNRFKSSLKVHDVSLAEAGNIMGPGKLAANPLDAISLGLALMFGTAGFTPYLDAFLHRKRC